MSDDILAETEKRMPPGTRFVYLGRPCVVVRYAGEAEATYSDAGYFGLVYEYADEGGGIHRSCVAPRDLPGFLVAIVVGCIESRSAGEVRHVWIDGKQVWP